MNDESEIRAYRPSPLARLASSRSPDRHTEPGSMAAGGAPTMTIDVSEAAARHLVAWGTDQRVRALHEAGHAVIGHLLGFPIKSIDTRGHDLSYTEVGDRDDDQPEFETGSRMLDRMVMQLGGQASEKLVLGEGTTAGTRDLADATSTAMARIDAGLDPRAPFISHHVFRYNPPDAISDQLGRALVAAVADARARADVMAAGHHDAIVTLAERIFEARRLTDERLADAFRDAGLAVP